MQLSKLLKQSAALAAFGVGGFCAQNASAQVLINELDSDTPSTDTAEFIELINKGGSSVDLSAGGYVLVFYNGATLTSYFSVDLTGTIAANDGLYVVGNAAVPNVDQVFADGSLQNGADGVRLVSGSAAANYPNGTAIGTIDGTAVDAVAYDTSDADIVGLISGLGVSEQVDENGAADGANDSIQRNTYTAFNWSGSTVDAPTPGAGPVPVELSDFSVE